MSKHVIDNLVFRIASELPITDLDGQGVLVRNPCAGGTKDTSGHWKRWRGLSPQHLNLIGRIAATPRLSVV